jgi:hypothetical protein
MPAGGTGAGAPPGAGVAVGGAAPPSAPGTPLPGVASSVTKVVCPGLGTGIGLPGLGLPGLGAPGSVGFGLGRPGMGLPGPVLPGPGFGGFAASLPHEATRNASASSDTFRWV